MKNIKINPDTLLSKTRTGDILGHTVSIYLPDFLNMMGLNPNTNKTSVSYAVNKISNFNRILGITKEYFPEFGRTFQSIYPVMLFMGYEEETNTLHFSSPYMNNLIWKITQSSIKKDSRGNPKLNKKVRL